MIKNSFLNIVILLFSVNIVAENQLYLAEIRNYSDAMYKHVSAPEASAAFYVAAKSTKKDLDFSALKSGEMFQIACSDGSNPDIFMQFAQGHSSGDCGSVGILPKLLAVWTDDPSAIDAEKVFVRFCITDTDTGRGIIGLKIVEDGGVRLFSVNGVKFLDKDIVIEEVDALEKILDIS